jgi:CYTH domain-containing protein/thymidylate kinase
MTDIPLIAITGGPCSGKTSLLAGIDQYLNACGFRAIVIPEAATEVFQAGLMPEALGNEVLQEHLLRYILEREERYRAMATHLPKGPRTILLCDRGGSDGEAYTGEAVFARILAKVGQTRSGLHDRYAAAIHLVTAADGAEEHYTLANNSARIETSEMARVIDQRTQRAWLGHRHLRVIDNSTGFEEKKRRALKAIADIIGTPEPRDFERKFLVTRLGPDFPPQDARKTTIKQTYLVSSNLSEQRRVRKRTVDGMVSYFYATTRKVLGSAERMKLEQHITRQQYLDLVFNERDAERKPIVKDRYHFVHGNQHFELDVFNGRLGNTMILEVRVGSPEDHLELPPEWKCVDVTGEDEYQNRTLALRA